jgi:prephenate dehydrogenase
MKHQEAPGTTFKRHLAIAKGVLSEDRNLLREILFNPHTPEQMNKIQDELKELTSIIANKDEKALGEYITRISHNIL